MQRRRMRCASLTMWSRAWAGRESPFVSGPGCGSHPPAAGSARTSTIIGAPWSPFLMPDSPLWIAKSVAQQLVDIPPEGASHGYARLSGRRLRQADCCRQAQQGLDAGGIGAAEAVHEWMCKRQADADAAALLAGFPGGRPVAHAYPVADSRIGGQLDDNAPGLALQLDVDGSLCGKGFGRGQCVRRRPWVRACVNLF